MLLSLDDPCWFYMEIPKTGTSAIYHALQHSRKNRSAECYPRHWPLLPPKTMLRNLKVLFQWGPLYSGSVLLVVPIPKLNTVTSQ